MSEWKKVRLGEVAELVAGYAFKSKCFGDYNSKVIKITDINNEGFFCAALPGVDISQLDKKKLDKYLVKRGDYVLAMTGSIGKIGKLLDGMAYINQRVLTVKASENTDHEYLYFCLKGKPFLEYMLTHIDSHSVQANISASTIGDFEIPLPPLPTQRRIAAVLSSLDDKIENNRKICANLEAQAQAIFKSWFVDEYSQEIPLARVCTKISDGVHNTVCDEPGSRFMLLSCKNIINGVVDISQGYRTIHQNTFQELRSRTQLEYGDILVGSVGTIGEIALVNDNAEDYEFQRSVAILKPNKELISSAYLYYALNAYKKKLINVAHGAVQQCIFLGDFREFAIPFGSRRRIIQFDELVMPLMREKYSLVKQTDSLAALRDALLPKLMSGEIDVEKVDVA